MTAPATPILSGLSDEEERTLGLLRSRIGTFRKANERQITYYEGDQIVRQLNISVPPGLRDLPVSCGWPGTVVDVLWERLEWDNWTSVGDLMDLDTVYRENRLGVESRQGILDSLISGVGFLTVGKGDTTLGEPEVLITTESPLNCTVDYDPRTRRAKYALSRTVGSSGQVDLESLYLPNETIVFERIRNKLVVVDRDTHNMNRVPVVGLVNNQRSSRTGGRSEITKPIRYLADDAVRTMLGMEINREFYTAPQRYVLGADAEQFVNAKGEQQTGWEAVMGRMNVLPRDEDGNLPEVGQHASSPPTPYVEQMRFLAQMLSAEASIPANYLGFVSENPASADAIRAAEARLVMRALARQASLTNPLRETAYLSLLVRDGSVDMAEFLKLAVKWRDPETPTKAAAADATSKIVGMGTLQPDSTVVYDRLGLTSQEQLQVTEDNRRKRVANIRAALPAAVSTDTPTSAVPA